MYLSYMQGPPNNDTVYTGQLPNVPVYSSFGASIQSNLPEYRSKTYDDVGSTTSESSLAVSYAAPSSISESTDVSQSVRTDPTMVTWQYGHQMPQVFLQQTEPQAYQQVTYQPTIPQAYQQVTCSPQHYQNFLSPEIAAANPSYVNMLPYQLQQAPITTSQTCQVQAPYFAYPMQLQQPITTAHNLTRVPPSTTVMTSVEDPMVYSASESDTQPASPNLNTTAVTTPSVTWSSMPGYVNTYPYVNSSVASSSSNTPMPCAIQSSIVPPFQLSNNLPYTNIPDQISCNINPTPGASAISNREKTCKPSSEKVEVSKPDEREVENLWVGNCSYTEYNHNGASNLFVTWYGTESELLGKLQYHKLEIRTVSKCGDECIFNVVFENHLNARKAFLMQRDIRLRMVPPKGSHRNWLRNPSPKYLVKFETRCRLVVKKGKAECHEIVGDLLMSNCQQQKGCLIWADQLKGHRIRVVSCEGNFMFPGGRIVQMKGATTEYDRKTSLGWISYRCKYTRDSFVTRRSGNSIGDYVYTE